jgi:myo-inositol-1(or 4)-monophosphatase
VGIVCASSRPASRGHDDEEAPLTDVELAIAVAESGASIVRERFGASLDRLDKGGGDFATSADVDAENAMLAILRRERPRDVVIGEESGRTGAADGGRTWLLDPLCGTLNYAVRTRLVAVNVALRVNGRAVAAAVADPFNDELYWTDMASACLRREGSDTALRPSAASGLIDLNFDPPFQNAPRFRAVALAGDPAFVARFRPRVVSSTIALAWVATGQRAGYVTDGDLRDSVHFAAGLALCQGAGCVVTNLFGEPWESGPTGLIAAADNQTHAALLALVSGGSTPGAND